MTARFRASRGFAAALGAVCLLAPGASAHPDPALGRGGPGRSPGSTRDGSGSGKRLAGSGSAEVPVSPPEADAVDPVPDPVGLVRFRTFGGAEGLRNLVIVGIVQDREGFLWVGTDDGIYRYDGHHFAQFSVEQGLPSSSVISVGLDPEGRVCAGGAEGLACWDGIRFRTDVGAGLPTGMVHAIASRGETQWVGTEQGLYVRRRGEAFVAAPGWPAPAATPVDSIWADAEGIAVTHGDQVEVSTGDGRWRAIGAPAGLNGDRIDSLLRDRQGSLWIRSTRSLWVLGRGQARAVDLSAGLPPSYDSSAVATTLALGPAGEVQVATDAGVAIRRGGAWRVVGPAQGLPAVGARTLLVDREGSLWIGSTGLFQWMGRGVVERFDATSVPGTVVWHVARDTRGTLWIGTHRCLARAALPGGWECMPGTEGRVVRSFVVLPSGAVFLGGAPGDLLYIGSDGVRATLGREFDRPADHFLRALVLGREGDLWIGTRTGLYRLPGATPGPISRVQMPGVPIDVSVSSLAVTDGQLWIGTAGGVVVNDRGRWHRFGKRSGFRADAMPYVAFRRDGRACVAYGESFGVTCFQYREGAVSELEHVGVADGLTSGRVYFLGEDGRGRLWIGTGDGVDVVTDTGVEHFGEADGLAGNDSAATAFFHDQDGSLWLGSTAGLTRIDAMHYDGPSAPPRTTIVGGTTGDRPIDPAGPVMVAHDDGALSVEYVANSFLGPSRIEYQVRLAPLEENWVPARTRMARYAALPPGSYRLEVRARVGAGPWGPATWLDVTVSPAWWQSSWFMVLLAAAALGGIAGAFALRERAVLRRHTRQIRAESSANFRTLIESLPDLVSIHRDGKLVYLNQAARRMLGVSDDESTWSGSEFGERIHLDDRPLALDLAQRVFAADTGTIDETIEVRVHVADGAWRSCEITNLRMDFGGAPVLVVTGRDVTDEKRMREKVLMSDRMASLGTLAAGIGHEINNPLSYVTGNLEVVADAIDRGDARAPGPAFDELRTALEEAREGAERVRKIVHSLRSLSRPDRGDREALPVQAVLEASIRLTANEIRHRAELVRQLAPVPLVAADDGQLGQVFINLLVNAAHAIPEGAADRNTVTVRTRTDDAGRAVIEIEDTGRGMTPEIRARAFDPFYTTRAVGAGSGLGLSVCHGIVTGLGGQISIESVHGRGTLVRVVLPPAPAPDEATEPEAAGPEAAGPSTDAHLAHRTAGP